MIRPGTVGHPLLDGRRGEACQPRQLFGHRIGVPRLLRASGLVDGGVDVPRSWTCAKIFAISSSVGGGSG